jgi:phosphate transport system substrate-binding protein
MMMRRLTVVAGALALTTGAVRAQQSDLSQLPAYKPEQTVAGTIRIVGGPLRGYIEAWEQAFAKYHPGIVFTNNFTTSSEGAMAGLYLGVSDIGPAGDDAKLTDQKSFFDVYRYLPLEVSVATGGYEKRGTLFPFVIVVNKANPIAKLTIDQLDGIFGAERTGGWEGLYSLGYAPGLIPYPGGPRSDGFTAKYARGPEKNIRTWGQLGLGGEWANKPIQTYGYVSYANGFTYFFQRRVLHMSSKWNPNYKEFTEAARQTPDEPGNPVRSERMLEELSKDRYGIAWAAPMHVKNYPDVKKLALAETAAGPYVEHTPETVANRTYPLYRNAYIYLNRQPGRPLDPKVREFMRFILSREGQAIIPTLTEYNPLTPDALREELKKID